MTVMGPKEVETDTIPVRFRFVGDIATLTVEDFARRSKFAPEN